MKSIYRTLPLVALLAFAACNPDTSNYDIIGMVAGSSPRIDLRFEESQAYNAEHGVSIINALNEDYRVYVGTDIHIDSTRRNWETFISDYHADLKCPVALLLGDFINAQNHWAFMAGALDAVPRNPLKADTLMPVIGNHDIYFNQWNLYRKFFKTSTYYFIVRTPAGKQDLYIVLDSSEGTMGSKQLAWLREVLQWADNQPFRHRIVCTHTSFFKRDSSQGHTSNYPLEEVYALLNLIEKHHIDMVWTGHDHSREVTQVKSTTCIIVDTMQDIEKTPFYMVVDMGEDIDYHFVSVRQNK